MDFWMFARRDLPGDLLDIFTALGDVQYQYDWIISDHDLYFAPNAPEEVRRRWSWTGLLIGRQELTEHLSSGYISFVAGGILSAVPKGTQPEQVRDYVPGWEIAELGSPDYRFQTPLTQMEIICYDGYAWLIICQLEMTPRVQKAFPQAKEPGDFLKDSGNKNSGRITCRSHAGMVELVDMRDLGAVSTVKVLRGKEQML